MLSYDLVLISFLSYFLKGLLKESSAKLFSGTDISEAVARKQGFLLLPQ